MKAKKVKIILVAGARPNFMKIAPLYWGLQKESSIEFSICHTGQHFDEKMSQTFFNEFDLPKPKYNLGISGGSHAEQTARIMVEFEKILLQENPDLIVVVGDVNSTVACSLTASKLGIKIAHVEAGLRSFDRTMPEEINRIVTDSISDLLFVSEQSGMSHLKHEGIDDKKFFFVGNIMIDTLIHLLPQITESTIAETLHISNEKFILTTFHRPSNVDDVKYLNELITFFQNIALYGKIVFPIHPRTKANFEKAGLLEKLESLVILTPPLGYIDFVALQKNATLIITDSGGVQEESTWLGVPCVTVRNNTERPITVTQGTNILAGTDLQKVFKEVEKIVLHGKKVSIKPELWDGKAAERILSIIKEKITFE